MKKDKTINKHFVKNHLKKYEERAILHARTTVAQAHTFTFTAHARSIFMFNIFNCQIKR